jgi:deazaflavin-dependent oxidoreductase (nitroreductase family)
MSHKRIRTFNKYVINPVMRRFARVSRGPFAVVQHVGRRSGKPYATPIIVEPFGKDVVIALTYGPEVDWYRNVQAAGRCTLLWHGKTYALEQPAPVDREHALPAFPLPAQLILRALNIQHFVRMQRHEGAPARSRA